MLQPITESKVQEAEKTHGPSRQNTDQNPQIATVLATKDLLKYAVPLVKWKRSKYQTSQ